MAEEMVSLPWRKQRQPQAASMYTSFASMDGMEEMDDSKAIGAVESLQGALRTAAQVLSGVLCMPPVVVAEACSEQGGLDCPRMRRVTKTLTRRRLCVGWIVLNALTPTALYAVSSPAMAKAVLGVHVAVLLSIPAALVGIALMDPKGWEMRDARGFEREVGSEHILDVRLNRDNVLKGVSAVLVQLQFVSLQFGVPMVDPGGSPFRLPGEGGTIWGEDVDQFVSHFMHYGLDILWWIPYWSRYSDIIVSVLVWATLVWCAMAQVANARRVEDDRQAKSRSLRMAYSSLTGIGLFCVVVALTRGVSRYMECPTHSGSDGWGDGYCSIVLPDDQGPSISSMLYTRHKSHSALAKLCGEDVNSQDASLCKCVDRQRSRISALVAVFTMSYFTVWAVFVRSTPSIASTISAVDLDIVAPQPVQAAECLTRIVVASVCTIASPHMGRQGDKALAVLSCMVATGGALLLCTRLWTYSNIRNANQMARTVTACAAWIGFCSVWATLDQSCIADHKPVALGTGCAILAAGMYARSVCCRPKVAVGARESLLSPTEMGDTDVDSQRKSFRDLRPEYGLHTRSAMQRCRFLGLCVVSAFTIAMILFAWAAGLDKCKEFSATHDGENTTQRIESICWAEGSNNDAGCPDLRSNLDSHSNVQAWESMNCTGVGGAHVGDACTVPSPACEPGWLAVSQCDAEACSPTYMDGENVICRKADFDSHLKPFWWPSKPVCKQFTLDDLIARSEVNWHSCKSGGLRSNREWKLTLERPIAKAPCIHICSGIEVSIEGGVDTTWLGSQVNRSMRPEGDTGTDKVAARLLFDVRCNGTLSLSSLRINRTWWDEKEPDDHSSDGLEPYLVVWQNAIMVRSQATASIQKSILRGIQLYVDPDADAFNLSHIALVPLVDRHDGSGKQNKAQGGAAGQYQLHPSCITVCRTLPESVSTYLPSKGLCDATAQPLGAGTGHFYVSNSILSMTYLNTPHPLPVERSYITFTQATFYMSSLVGGQPVTQPRHQDQKKLMYTDAMANDQGKSTPLFPISRSILLDEDKVVSPNRQLLSATFVNCHLAGCSSTYDFCEGQPTEQTQALSTPTPGSDVFANLNSFGQEHTLRVNVTASTPTFGDRLLFSVDVLPGMNVSIMGRSNVTSGSEFFLKGVFRRKVPEMWFFRGGHLRIENLRMDYCVDQIERDSWLPSRNDRNVGDAHPSDSSLTLVNTFNLYTHIFRKGAYIESYQGGRQGMPNYDRVVSLINISIASYSGMETCRDTQAQCPQANPDCYNECAQPECEPVLTVSTCTEGLRRFLNVTQLAASGQPGNADRFGSWQPEIGDQLFDWNVSWYGTYMGRQSHVTPNVPVESSLPVLFLGAGDLLHGGGRWGVSEGFHLELRNVWLVADLETEGQPGQPCCRPGVKTTECKSVSDSRCGACAPVDDGTVLAPIAGQGDSSCLAAFASNRQPITQDLSSSWHSGMISFHTVAIQYKRVQIQTNSSCDNARDTCALETVETLPLNIMGPGTPFVSFEDCEFARSESATVNPRSIFAAFSMSSTRLDIMLVTDSPLLMLDLRQNDTTDAGSPSQVPTRNISIVGINSQGRPKRRNRLFLRRLLLSDSQRAAFRDLDLKLSFDHLQSSQPPLIEMVNVGILSQGDAPTSQSPFGVFSGLSHWDVDTCKHEQTWCATMKNVMIMPKGGADRDVGASPCIDHRGSLPVAYVNTVPGSNAFRKSRLDIVVSSDDLDFADAVRAASARATVTVSGSMNQMWCDSGEPSNGNSRNTTACYRLNASTRDCTTGNGFFTRTPRVAGVTLQSLKADCADKLCVLQNVTLNHTGESLADTNNSLHSFSLCNHNQPEGVRFGGVNLENSTGLRTVAVATLTERCTSTGVAPSIDEMASNCNCMQQMWYPLDDPRAQQRTASNFTKR